MYYLVAVMDCLLILDTAWFSIPCCDIYIVFTYLDTNLSLSAFARVEKESIELSRSICVI